MLILLPILTVVLAIWILRTKIGIGHKLFLEICAGTIIYTSLIAQFYSTAGGSWRPIFLNSGLAFCGVLALIGITEYGILRLLSQLRLGALVRVTFYEIILQPFTLLLVLGFMAILAICAFLPYYTFNEDNKMFRDVTSQFVLIVGLAITIYGAAKVIDDEIENRTMLTLMSKPISRHEVIIGKYLGLLCALFLLLGIMGIATGTTSTLHWYEDRRLDINLAANANEMNVWNMENLKNSLALIPLFVLQFLELATLGAIAVAISTRYSLALNVTIIVLIYIVANLAGLLQFMEMPDPWKSLVTYGSYLLPNLQNFDISQRLIYGEYALDLADQQKMLTPNHPIPITYSQIWGYTGMVGAYAAFYITGALSFATVMFRTRELT